MGRMMQRQMALVAGCLLLGSAVLWVVVSSSGVGSAGAVAPAPTSGPALATWTATDLVPGSCAGDVFVRHELAHTTRASDAPARLFDSNGSGVAADDLDGDGLADIVLGNLEGPNTILWNEGDWTFTAEQMNDRSTRTVQLVDIDADGRLDIVTTHRGAGVAAFRNLGDRSFKQVLVRGVNNPAYSMAWGDLDLDGDLDLVTGSYDAELDQQLRSTFLFSDGAGVFQYLDTGDSFEAERLTEDSQALVTALLDLDQDGLLDVMVGNDFAMHDMTWSNQGSGSLVPIEPFNRIAAHTMSIDAGDIDADGVDEIFATDMKPASTSLAVISEWLPLMATMDDLDNPADTQRIRNVLQVNQGDGTFKESGERAGLDSAGWAWSARFGDLDNDADLDLYVVNGMIAAETFAYLDGAEIVEPNITFVNHGDGTFGMESWGLDALESGRGSVLVDLDNDGRLDIVVNNLDSPAVAFENRKCGGAAIEFALRQPDTNNTHAIGATVTIVTGDQHLVRTVRSGGGYLSGTPTTLHIGLGDRTTEYVEIRWPDGATTTIDAPTSNTLYEVTRT
jgi:hypothetical protein